MVLSYHLICESLESYHRSSLTIKITHVSLTNRVLAQSRKVVPTEISREIGMVESKRIACVIDKSCRREHSCIVNVAHGVLAQSRKVAPTEISREREVCPGVGTDSG